MPDELKPGPTGEDLLRQARRQQIGQIVGWVLLGLFLAALVVTLRIGG